MSDEKEQSRTLYVCELTRRTSRFREYIWITPSELNSVRRQIFECREYVEFCVLMPANNRPDVQVEVNFIIPKTELTEFLYYKISVDKSQIKLLRQKTRTLEHMLKKITDREKNEPKGLD